MKPKNFLDGLQIFERLNTGRSFDRNFKDRPVMSIRNTWGCVSNTMLNTLKIKDGDEILLAKRGEEMYLATPPTMSSLKGYRVRNYAGYNIINTKSWRNRGIDDGIYEINIKDAVFANDIDWYPLDKVGG